jgi:hypothetical protein
MSGWTRKQFGVPRQEWIDGPLSGTLGI